jgi:hypothetical protein
MQQSHDGDRNRFLPDLRNRLRRTRSIVEPVEAATINGGLACSGNALAFPGPGGVPTNSFDGSPPNPNIVNGSETGQCAGL